MYYRTTTAKGQLLYYVSEDCNVAPKSSTFSTVTKDVLNQLSSRASRPGALKSHSDGARELIDPPRGRRKTIFQEYASLLLFELRMLIDDFHRHNIATHIIFKLSS